MSAYLQILISTIFIISGISKYISFKSFKNTLKKLKLYKMIYLIAPITVPFIELVIGVMILFQKTLLIAITGLFIMLLIFLWVNLRAFTLDVSGNCSCC